MRSSGAFSFLAQAVVLIAMCACASAQEVPRFRAEPVLFRPVEEVSRSTWSPPRVEAPLPPLPPVLFPSAAPRRRPETYVPLALRRQRSRTITPDDLKDAYTLRTPESLGVSARLSVGFLGEIRLTDNINSVQRELALKETVVDFTPIMRLTVGGSRGLKTAPSTEPEYYLDALYTPTFHQLLRSRTSEELRHLLILAGRATPIFHAGVRIDYDEEVFSSGGDGSAEDSFTSFEVEPIIEYRTSAKTTLHFRANRRRITLEQPGQDRTDDFVDAAVDVEMSVKTTAGAGAEIGRIDFDVPELGFQDYRQGYLTFVWLATAKVNFQARAGVEWREFTRLLPKPDQVSPVALAVLTWRPTEETLVAASFRVRNQPSVSQQGALFREIKFGLEASHEIGFSFYVRGELEYLERNYDTMRWESEATVRPALGYNFGSTAAFDTVKLEVYYQFRRHWNLGGQGNYDRNQAGVQIRVLF